MNPQDKARKTRGVAIISLPQETSASVKSPGFTQILWRVPTAYWRVNSSPFHGPYRVAQAEVSRVGIRYDSSIRTLAYLMAGFASEETSTACTTPVVVGQVAYLTTARIETPTPAVASAKAIKASAMPISESRTASNRRELTIASGTRERLRNRPPPETARQPPPFSGSMRRTPPPPSHRQGSRKRNPAASLVAFPQNCR
jgi:hypothetical protein